MKKVLSILLTLALVAGAVLCAPFSAGAVTTDSQRNQTYMDITFSDYLNKDMTSDQISLVLESLGIIVKSGSPNFSVDTNRDLVITAASETVIYLVKDNSQLKSSNSVEVDLGLKASRDTDSWAFHISNDVNNAKDAEAENPANCYKVQFTRKTTTDDTAKNYYLVDPTVKVGGDPVYLTGTTKIVQAASGTTADDPNTQVTLAETTDIQINVDRAFGMYTYINGKLIQEMKNGGTDSGKLLSLWNQNADTVMNQSDTLLTVSAGTTLTLEYARVCDKVSEVTITEVSYRSYDAVEIYNSSNQEINIYDYCLYVATPGTDIVSFLGKDDQSKWGTETATIGYTIPGEYQYTYAGTGTATNQSVKLTNPAYSAGVLQPGECAVLYIPQNAIGPQATEATEPLTLVDFRKTFGMDTDSKVFYCYSNLNLDIYGNTEDTNDGGTKLSNMNSYTMVGVGRVNHLNKTTYQEPTVVDTTFMRESTANNTWIRTVDFGMFLSHVYIRPTTSTSPISTILTNVKCYYTGWSSSTNCSTAEFYPYFTVTADSGTYYYGKTLYASGAKRTVGTDTAAQDSLGVVLDEQKVEYDSATDLLGYQRTLKVTADGDYGVRFVATLDELGYDTVGFEITAIYYADGELTAKTVDGKCQYAYKSINGNGNVYAARDYDHEYLIAYHINGIPTDAGSITYVIRPYTQTNSAAKAYGHGAAVAISAPTSASNS